MYYNGLRIIENPLLTKPFQTKTTKRKKIRIQKKYRKRYTIQVPDTNNAYVLNKDTVVMHPAMAVLLRQALDAQRSE